MTVSVEHWLVDKYILYTFSRSMYITLRNMNKKKQTLFASKHGSYS